MIDGVRVGELLSASELAPQSASPGGSAMVIVATDAPLDARQFGRIARRGALGLARTGSIAHHGSGDFVLAFSTASRVPQQPMKLGAIENRDLQQAIVGTRCRRC